MSETESQKSWLKSLFSRLDDLEAQLAELRKSSTQTVPQIDSKLESQIIELKNQLEKIKNEETMTVDQIVEHLISCPVCSVKLADFVKAQMPKIPDHSENLETLKKQLEEIRQKIEEKKEEVKKVEEKKDGEKRRYWYEF